ncbi:Beige/BEACH domain containing protein [Tritrichomonas foetus]|uniref:Beige/BEACH domain containing protein n=1 Tax=Tritrichomonas foetus TaxID=1144522 RepID=A0A1J4KM57_9EUKA|nr:Beige/BEACH domain containing protein [Tritrichomonas foetus]|eukprot:OHT12399.1 Beige/BEACH domain containing protein [Tritrichomonas foetus]
MSWFEKTFRSFSIGGASAFRFLGDDSKNPEAKTFHKMVRDLPSKSPPTPCINYFLEHFGHYNENEIKSLRLEHEITYVIILLVPYLLEKFKTVQSLNSQQSVSIFEQEFTFLIKSIHVYVPDPKSNQVLFDFIFKILESDNEKILTLSSLLIQKLMLLKSFQSYFFKGESCIRLWNTCFVKNPNSNQICGPIFINTFQKFTTSHIEKVKPLLAAIIDSFQFMRLCEATAQNSIEFVSNVIMKFNTANFLPTFMKFAFPFFALLKDFTCFTHFLTAQTADPVIPWQYLNKVIRHKELKSSLLISALDIVHSLRNSSQIYNLKMKPFALRAKELDSNEQIKVFDLLKLLPLDEKYNFFLDSVPTWETGVDTALLEMLVKENDWGDLIGVMISQFVLVDDFPMFKQKLIEDKSISEIISYMFSQVTPEIDLSIALFEPLVELSQEKIPVAIEGIRKLTEKDDATMFAFPFITALQEQKITDEVFEFFTELSIKSPLFVTTFLQNEGIVALFCSLKSQASIDFLAAIAGNGPYDPIDDYIFEHFEESELANLSQDSLRKLMMGLRHDSESTGMLRIPSLCKFVQNIPILTQFDRYIFGNYALKFIEPTKEQLFKYAPTYMEQNIALDLCNDPEMLSHLTNPNYQHFPVFQCHVDSPHCAASLKLAVSTTFWIYIEKIFGKTTILSTHFGEIVLEADMIQFFGLPKVTCLPQRWHMITILISDRTFTQQNVTCYFNKNFVGTSNTGYGSRATLGSETETNGIYYFSGSFQCSRSLISMSDIKHRFKAGPGVFCPTSIRMKPGFLFIPYKGIAKYLPRLGGQEFIFIKLLDAKDSHEFNLLLQSAFNLLHLHLIEPSFFFCALRYVLFRQKSLFDSDLEPLLLHELQVEPEKRWTYANLLLCDYNLLTAEKMTLTFLPQIIETVEDSSQLFSFLFDTYIIFNLNEESERNIIDCLENIINANPILLKKVLLMITASNFIESPDFSNSLFDPTMKRKQDILYQIIINNMDLLPKFIPFDLVFDYLSTLRDDLALDLLHTIAKMTLVDPSYFNIDVFKKWLPLFTIFAKNESVWNVLFIFYTGGVADTIEDYAELDIIRPTMTEDLLELVCDRMTYESNSLEIELLSLRILKTIIKLISNAGLDILDYLNQVQRLCALGFDQYPNSPMPFSLEEDNLKPKLLSMIQSTLLSREKIGKFNYTRVHPLDPSLFEETKKYLRKMELPLNNNLSESINRSHPSEEIIKKFINSEISDIISKLAACALVQKLNNLTIARKIAVKILINGSDVLPEISVPMHRKIALSILSCSIQLNDEAYDFFIKFEITRIIEGWWNGEIVPFFQLAFPRTCKSTKSLFISCLLKCETDNERLKMMIFLCNSPLFAEYSTDSFFISCIAQALATPEIVNSDDFPYIKRVILLTVPESSFSEALSKDKLYEYVASLDKSSFYSIMNEINKSSFSSSKLDRETRLDITRYSSSLSTGVAQMNRLLDAHYVRSAFRYQFLSRFNVSNLEIDFAISKIFQKKVILNFNENPTKKFMVSTKPQPFVVPQKIIPLVYDYPIPDKKSAHQLPFPQSHHKRQYPTLMQELQIEDTAPLCLEGWDLPPIVKSISLTPLLKVFFESRFLISCSMLSTAEVLTCVASYNSDNFSILMNAELINNKVVLKQGSDMLCHFAALENALHGVYGECRLFANHPVLKFSFNDVLIAIPRRFVYQNTEIDLFLVNGLHFTFVLKESERKVFMARMKPLPYTPCSSGPVFAANLLCLGLQNVTKLWVNQLISTYDYLLYLNISSGRSFNDLSQYPVFPWILGDFEKEVPVIKRDLTKPMGAQTKQRMDRFKINFEEAYPHCHYGTHYSHPAAVLHYMMRVEPFTLFNLHLHNGMDHVDRQFTSISDSWRSASESNQSDLKELIPEFYTFPLMFENVNDVDFKCRTDGTSLNTVVMPSWGTNTFLFVWKMRQALECPEATSKINDWIDLIFGYKQRGQAAIDAVNVFQPLTYGLSLNEDPESSADLVKGMVDAVNQFGQCPVQLFTSPHPKCERTDPVNLLNAKININPLARVSSDIDSIQFNNDLPLFLPKFEHRIGPKRILIKVWDSYIEQGDQIIPSVDACSASCISKDALYLAVSSRLGFINVFSCINGTPIFMKQLITTSFEIKTLAISSQHGLVCASDEHKIMLFDYTTSLLIRELNVGYEIIQIQFDDISNLIICLSRNGIHVYGLDFRLVAKTPKIPRAFSCLAVCDSSVWSYKPFYATGHVGGFVYAWTLDIDSQTLKHTQIMQIGKTLVTALTIFANNKAILAVDRTGCLSLASIVPLKEKFISSKCFNQCCVCQCDITPKTAIRCSSCGLFMCKSCIVSRKPRICSTCNSMFSGSESGVFDVKTEEEESAELPIESTENIKSASNNQNEAKIEEEESSDSFGFGIDLTYRDPTLGSVFTFQLENMPRNFRHSI